jgi:hypothetical protein
MRSASMRFPAVQDFEGGERLVLIFGYRTVLVT